MKFSEFKSLVDDSQSRRIFPDTASQRAKNLEVILEIVNKINHSLILDEVLELVLKSAITYTDSDRGFIVLSSKENKLEFKLGLDSIGNKLSETNFKVSFSVIHEVYNTGLSKFVESAQSDVDNKKSKSIFLLELETILCSPLITGGKKLGVLYVDSKRFHKINIKEITDTFEILAGQAATAIRNAQLYQGQLNAYQTLQEVNRQLTIAKEEAEKSDKLKTEFLAQMSHEIRTPIHILMSYSSLIKDEIEDSLDEDLKSNFNAIDDAGKRIIRTTDLILNMAEIQTGTYDYDPTTFDFYEEILLPLHSEFKIQADEKKLTLNINLLNDSHRITADKYSIYQIFSNLIDNAIKYTKSGAVEINFYRDASGRAVVQVKDTGIGIAKEYLPNLFKPFTQEQQGYNRVYEGNGLGLALVKSYCDLNKAEIKVKSKKGEGTIFTITLK